MNQYFLEIQHRLLFDGIRPHTQLSPLWPVLSVVLHHGVTVVPKAKITRKFGQATMETHQEATILKTPTTPQPYSSYYQESNKILRFRLIRFEDPGWAVEEFGVTGDSSCLEKTGHIVEKTKLEKTLVTPSLTCDLHTFI